MPEPLDTYRNVNTSGVPLTGTLHLEVGDTAFGGQVGSNLTFTTLIVDTGTLSFDCTAGYGGGGPNNLEFLLNGVAVATHPMGGSFSTSVVPSDIFGFRLTSTLGTYSSEVMVNVSNFNVPEPGTGGLLLGAGLALVRRRRYCGFQSNRLFPAPRTSLWFFKRTNPRETSGQIKPVL